MKRRRLGFSVVMMCVLLAAGCSNYQPAPPPMAPSSSTASGSPSSQPKPASAAPTSSEQPRPGQAAAPDSPGTQAAKPDGQVPANAPKLELSNGKVMVGIFEAFGRGQRMEMTVHEVDYRFVRGKPKPGERFELVLEYGPDYQKKTTCFFTELDPEGHFKQSVNDASIKTPIRGYFQRRVDPQTTYPVSETVPFEFIEKK